MHHQEVTKDLILNIQDILASSNLRRYGNSCANVFLILVKVMNALMNQWSNRITIANILLHLEASFTPLIGLLYFKENMTMKIKRKNQTKSCLRRK